MKKKIYIIIIILILIFIILNFYKSNKNIINDIMIFDLWEDIGIKTNKENNQNTYVINPVKQDNIQIDVYKTIQNSYEVKEVTDNLQGNKIYKKIAPGSYGNFLIKLERPFNSKCNIIVNDLNSKPENLVFILDNKQYNSIKEMQNKLNEIFQVENAVLIQWEWKYENTQENNLQDTYDGENVENYKFEVKAIIE